MLNFGNVKRITIPEGEVKIIKDKNNNILWNRLPKEYTELEYISFNNDIYFDSQIILDKNSKIEVVFVKIGNTDKTYFYGCHNVNNNYAKTYTAYFTKDPPSNWRLGTGIAIISWENNILYKSIQDKTGVKIINLENNNEKNYKYPNIYFFTTDGSCYIGASRERNTNSVISNKFEGKIYNFKIYDDDNLVANLIPAKNQNNIEGFYDVQRRIFLESLI